MINFLYLLHARLQESIRFTFKRVFFPRCLILIFSASHIKVHFTRGTFKKKRLKYKINKIVQTNP